MVAARLTDIADGKLTIKALEEVHAGEEIEVEIDREDLARLAAALAVTADSRQNALPPEQQAKPDKSPLTRENVRARLAEIGMLGTAFMPTDDLVAPTEEELFEIAQRASAGPSIREIMDEMRGRGRE